MKRAFKMKYKAFFIIFKGLLFSNKNRFFLEGESPTLSWVELTDIFKRAFLKRFLDALIFGFFFFL